MQSTDKKYAGSFNEWGHLVTSVAANATDLAHLETPRAKLAALLGEAQGLTTQQATLAAGKQEASKRLQQIVNEGRKLATFLRTGVREHYGNRAEKLTEFGVQPFRSRPRAKATATPTPTPTPAPGPTPTPTPTPTPGTAHPIPATPHTE